MPSPTPFIYTVQQGDTLIAIAKKFHVSIGKLAKVNNIKDVSLIYAGQQLIIPIDPSEYPDITPRPSVSPRA